MLCFSAPEAAAAAAAGSAKTDKEMMTEVEAAGSEKN